MCIVYSHLYIEYIYIFIYEHWLDIFILWKYCLLLCLIIVLWLFFKIDLKKEALKGILQSTKRWGKKLRAQKWRIGTHMQNPQKFMKSIIL